MIDSIAFLMCISVVAIALVRINNEVARHRKRLDALERERKDKP